MSEFEMSDFLDLFQYEGGNQGGDDGGSSGGGDDGGGGGGGYDGGNQGGGDGGGGPEINIDIFSLSDLIDRLENSFAGSLIEDFVEQVPPAFKNPIETAGEAAIEGFFNLVQSGLDSFFEGFFEALLTPLVGTPALKGETTAGPLSLAFRRGSNAPWDGLIQGLYFEGILGLALGIQFITLAAVGLRYKSMDPVVRKQVGRRVGWAFLAIFLWLPAASLATQFFNIIGRQLLFASYSPADAADTITSFGTITSLSFGAATVLMFVAVYVYLKALFITVARWIIVILLTLTMPLIAAFWPLEAWPFNRFAGTAKQVAGAYPGALAAGIPPAVLIRISLEVESFGLPGALTPLVAVVTLYLAAKSQKELIARSSRAAMRVSEQTLDGAKKPAYATGAIAATAAGASVGGAAGARVASRGIGTLSSVAKGQPGRTAFNVQRMQRGLSKLDLSSDADSNSDSSTKDDVQTQRDQTTVLDNPQFKQTQVVGNGSASKQPAGSNRVALTETVPSDQSGKETKLDGDRGDNGTTYWDVVDDDTQFGSDTDVYQPDTSPDVSADQRQQSDAAGPDDDSDDGAAAGAAPTTGGGDDGDSPDTDGAGNVEDLFATEDEVLGPDAYRPRNE